MTVRSLRLRLDDAAVVERAKRMIGYKVPRHAKAPPDASSREIAYRLKPGHNGGNDPTAEHCAGWSYGYRIPTSDCVGLWAWANGIDRYQSEFPIYGGWINCTSIAREAARPTSKWFVIERGPTLGGTIVYASDPHAGIAHGHVGIVTGLERGFDAGGRIDYAKVRVTHCSAYWLKRGKPLNPAIQETDATIWRKRGLFVRLIRR